MGILFPEGHVFFFFQAEDGIRDYKVTGVQTCALPIWGGRALPCERRGRPPVPGPGGARPPGPEWRLGVAGRPARRAAPRVEPVMRRLAVLLALGSAVACADWAGPRLGRPSLAIVPVFPGSQATVPAGDVLLGDLDRLRVIVTELPARRLVADTSVGVDAAGNAQVTVPVHVVGSSPTLFEVSLEGIRTSDGTVLYSGIDTVAVTGGIPIPPVAVSVIYVGPCQLGAGCRVTLGPQNLTLKLSESVTPTVSVD